MKILRFLILLLFIGSVVWAAGEKEQASEDGPVTLKLLVEYHTSMPQVPNQDLNNNEIINWIKEHSGYNFNIYSLPKEGDKLPIILASGEYYDGILINAPNMYFQTADQGIFIDLKPYLSSAQDLKNLIEKSIWDAAKVNGVQYGIPLPRGYDQRQGNWIRKDLLEKTGLDMPVTLEDYYETFKALKESGDFPAGFSVDIERDHEPFIQGFAGAFGISPQWVEKDGKLVYFAVLPEAKDYIAYCKKLFDEGLLDQEFGVNTHATVKEKLASGSAFAAQLPWWSATGVQKALKELDPSIEVVYCPAPVGPDGQSGLPYSGGPWRKIWVSPKTAKYTQEFVDFMNWMADLDNKGIQTISFGIEGKHWQMVDGQVKTLPASEEMKYQGVYNVMMPDEGPSASIRRQLNGHDKNYNAMNGENLLEDYSLSAPLIDAVVKNHVPVADYTRESHIKFIMGSRPLDEYDDFVKELMDRGLREATAALNEWFAEFK